MYAFADITGTRFIKWVIAITATVVGLLAAFQSQAATDRYDYDALGRLIRWVDGNGKATEYVYDAVGNILKVRSGLDVAPPTVNSVVPSSLRRGESQGVTVGGSGLNGTRLTTTGADTTVTGFTSAPDRVGFVLEVNQGATLGARTFTLESAAGAATFNLQVDPALPRMLIEPTPLAIPPDSVSRAFTIRLGNADAYDHVIGLSTADASVASVTPISLTIPAGQTEARANITGLQGGLTSILLSSPMLGTTAVPVYVTTEFAGINTSRASVLGVLKETAPTQKNATYGPIAAPLLGVARGPVIEGLTPASLSVGSGPRQVEVTGRELEGVTGVRFEPADGLTLSPPTASPDGTRVMVPVTVADNAPMALRRLVLIGSAASYPPAHPGADRLRITSPQPEVDSISPLFGQPGDNLMLTVRGRNLQYAGWLTADPGIGLTLGAPPSVSMDGTLLTTGLAISPAAPVGVHAISVTTPAGDSSSAPSPANVFTVVSEIHDQVTPISSALLGVTKEGPPQPASRTYDLSASPLGLAKGPVLNGLRPTAGSIGETVELAFSGSELGGVTAVEMQPADGLALGTPMPAADGHSFSLTVQISASAPRVPRRIVVKAGTQTVPAASDSAAVFRVVLPEPEIHSVSPLYFVAGGATATLTVRGRNLLNAEAVRLLPPDQVSVSDPPVVNADGTEAAVNLTVAAAAVLGERAVTVQTPAGESAGLATPGNTIRIVDHGGEIVTPLSAPTLGVVKEAPDSSPSMTIPLAAANVGVLLESAEVPPGSITYDQQAPHLGVIRGTVATGLAVPYLYPGATGELVVSGIGLGADMTASVVPSSGISLGAISAAPDGTSMTVPFAVADDAATGYRALSLQGASGSMVQFVPVGNGVFNVGVHAPRVDSIDPILADRGDVVSLLVRGAYLQGGRIEVEPAAGVQFEPDATANDGGTELTLRLHIADDAPLGDRVIRVRTVAGLTSAEPHPSNTFTVYPKP